jgi:hypothetical protein
MSINLTETMNAEHVQTANNRRCSHCHSLGHIITSCRRARSDGFTIHMQIINSIRWISGINLNQMLNFLRNKLYRYSVPELKLLMRINNLDTNSHYLCTLEELGYIPFGTRLVRIKSDKVTILSWIYLSLYDNDVINHFNSHEIKKWKLDVKLVEQDVNQFDCPICMESHTQNKKVITNCNHEVCNDCIMNYFHHLSSVKSNLNLNKPSCSLCRAEIVCLSFVSLENKDELTKKYVL